MTRRHLLILTDTQRQGMNPSLLEPIEYRKSGLSLNHIVGCPGVSWRCGRLAGDAVLQGREDPDGAADRASSGMGARIDLIA